VACGILSDKEGQSCLVSVILSIWVQYSEVDNSIVVETVCRGSEKRGNKVGLADRQSFLLKGV
jgi:hypothetical protein